MPSPPGWREVPCAECGTFVAGIGFGDRCPACFARRKRRVDRLTRRAALAAMAAMGVWIVVAPPVSSFGRWTAIIGVAATYLLVRVIVSRLAMELLP